MSKESFQSSYSTTTYNPQDLPQLRGQIFPLFYLVVWCWQGFVLSASGLEEKDSLAEVKVGEQSEKEKGVEHLQPIGGEHAVT